MKHLTEIELNKSLSIVDLTKSPNHAISIMATNIIKSLEKYNIEIIVDGGNPIVSPEDNYNKLYYPIDDITKSERYTRWVSNEKILRTQMTSLIPSILSSLKSEKVIACPGMVYRRDVVDKTHVGEPHQMDIWIISDKVKYDRLRLLDLVETVVDAILPGVKWRYIETNHNYTKDGIEVEIYVNGNWLEILECGLALPKLLDDSGLDSNTWSGLALGLGLDRAVMIRKEITDIRILRSQNPKISEQMSNLEKYITISKYNSVKRDMSISVDNLVDVECIGDLVRNSIEDIEIIEEVVIKSETEYKDLPPHVSERLGMTENMKNILIGITLCSLDHQIDAVEANDTYTLLYSKLHQGSKGYTI